MNVDLAVNMLRLVVAKFNPHHDAKGRFAPSSGTTFGEYTLPDVVYHGTTAEFDQFATPAMFSVNQNYSATLVQGSAGAKVIPVKLTLKNPADLRAMHLSPSDPNFRQIAQRLQAQGYDSAHYRGEAWVAFSPDQIERLDTGVKKFNPHHDSLGRFSSGGGSGGGLSSKGQAIAAYDRAKAEHERLEALSHYMQPREVQDSVTWQEKQAAREAYNEATTKLYKEFDAEYDALVSAEETKSKQVSPAKSVAALDATFEGHALDPEPAKGFEHYRNDGNKVINGVLRGRAKGLSLDDALKNAEPYGDQSWRTMMAPVTERSIAGLDEAFQKAPPLKADITVHRVIASGLAATGFKGTVPGTYDSRQSKYLYSSESSLHVAKALKQMEGTIFTDPGFVSTTTAKGETTKWSRKLNKNTEYEQPIYFTIKVPKGAKTIWAPKVAKEEDVFVKKEVLLPRNTPFRIVKVTVPKKLTGPFHVELEVVDEGN